LPRRRSAQTRESCRSVQSLLAGSFGTLPALVGAIAAERPSRAALVHGARALSYGEFDLLADRVAAALQRDGTASGDAVVICAASCSTRSRPSSARSGGAAAGCGDPRCPRPHRRRRRRARRVHRR